MKGGSLMTELKYTTLKWMKIQQRRPSADRLRAPKQPWRSYFPREPDIQRLLWRFFFLIVWRLFATLHMGRAGLLLWIVQVPYFPDQPRWRCGSDVSRTLLVQCQTNRFPQFAQIQNNNRAPYRFVARDAIAGDAADRLFVSWRDCSGINLLSFGQQLVAFIILSF